MKNTKNLKRRYFLTKTRKPRNKTKMNNEEVATDYKLQQFLADVEKFSERNKTRKEEKNTNKLPNEKRGLFENGMMSKPSVKGILGLKNKARLAGNLENLLNDDAPKDQLNSPSSSDSSSNMLETVVYKDARASTSKEKPERTVPGPDWWKTYADALAKKKQQKEEKFKHGENKSSKKSGETVLLDEAIDFAHKKAEEVKKRINDSVKEFEERCGPFVDQLNELQQRLLKDMEQRVLKKLMENDSELLKEVKRVQDEFFQFKKTEMVEKSVQTDFTFDIKKTNETFEKIEFTPEKRDKSFVLTVPKTGQPQKHFAPEKLLIPSSNQSQGNFTCENSEPLETTNFFESLPGPSGLQTKKEHIAFLSKDTKRTLHFLSPPKSTNSPFFDKSTPELRPPILDNHCWAPSFRMSEKPYFPEILSPLSPGRKYSKSPTFLDEPQWNHFKKPRKLDAFKDNLKENSFRDLSTDALEGFKCTSRSSFPFPKRLKVTFSPHRL